MEITDVLTFDEKAIEPSLPTGLWFCENVIEVSNVGKNAVCLSIGGTYEGVENFEHWFSQFKYIFICIANHSSRKEAEKELRTRLPNAQISVVADSALKGHKSIEAFRKAYGYDAVTSLLCGSVELPPFGLIDISEVAPIDFTRLPRTLSGIQPLDAATGGFLMGDVTVWTGKRGEGKSTCMNQILVRSVDQGHRCCCYSGELIESRLKEWIYAHAAGPKNLASKKDSTGREWWQATPQAARRIDEWMKKRLFLYDTKIAAAHDEDRILSIFEFAVKRYGASVFAIDNLMTTNFKRMKDSDYYRSQSQFVGRCIAFAKAFNVHVHIIAHPKKVDGKRDVDDGDDISGSGDVANKADNVIAVKRFKDDDPRGDAGLTVLKSRWTGDRVNVALKYEPKSRRFYATNGGNPNWEYGWEKTKQQAFEEITDETPFD